MSTNQIQQRYRDLLDERAAANRLKTSPHTLRRWRVERTGPGYVKVGRLIRYSEAELDRYLASRAVSNDPQTR